jgi:integrase
MDDLEKSFQRVFPSSKVRSYATKCVMLLEHLLPKVQCNKMHSFMQYFHDRIRDRYTTLTTVSNIFGEMRAKARTLRPDCHYQVFALTDTERAKMRKESEKKVEKNNNDVQSFSVQQIEHVVKDLTKSNDQTDKILLLMLQSGMRLIEVLRVARVRPSQQANYAVFTHLAKQKKNSKSTRVDKPLLFTDYKTFERDLASVRNYVRRDTAGKEPSMTNKELTNHFNHSVNMRVRKHLGGNYTSHIARKIYGSLSYKKHGDPQTTSLNAWLERVLGHKSITTSLSYSNVQVVD